MLLTSTESVNWKVPAPSWARRKVKEIRALQDDEEGSKLKAKLTAELPALTEYRLTFGTVTMAEEIKRDDLLKTVREGFETQHGINPGTYSLWFVDTFIREIVSEIEYERGTTLDRYQAAVIWSSTRDMADWATFMSCLIKVEERQASMLNGGEPAWKVIAPPESWYDFDGFIKQIPRKLLDACVEVCNGLNPGVWEVQMDDDAKNFGGVNEAT